MRYLTSLCSIGDAQIHKRYTVWPFREMYLLYRTVTHAAIHQPISCNFAAFPLFLKGFNLTVSRPRADT